MDRPIAIGTDRPSVAAIASRGTDGERQPTWAELRKELLTHPGEPRALFFDTSLAVDHAVSFSYDRTWIAEAELSDDRVVSALLDAGARVEEHRVRLPEYESRHCLSSGRRFSLDVHAATLYYVPHWSVGDEWGVEWDHRISVEWSSTDHQRLVEDLTADIIETEGVHERDFYVLTDALGRDALHTTCPSHYDLEDEAGRKRREEQTHALRLGRNRWRGKRLRPATRRDLAQSDEYVRIRGSYWAPAYVHHRPQAVFATSRSLARVGQLAVTMRSSERRLDVRDRLTRAAITNSLKRQILLSSRDAIGNKLAERLMWSMRVDSTRRTGRLTVPHEAPFSERGRLWVEGLEPEEATILMAELGIVGHPLGTVDYTAIYGARPHRRGCLTPPLRAFVDGASCRLPVDTMVLHGITGIEHDDAIERLKMICRSGGLKSIAERRRLGIDVDSMSPIGDIASGIDRGVSATVGRQAHYGGAITFILKPTVLTRRDVWFSDQDFGASDARYEHYSSYARSIGQARIYLPPDMRARERHLKHGTRMPDNEVYLKHHVALEEIDAIAVEGSLGTKACLLAKRLRRDGIPVPPVIVCRVDPPERKPKHHFPTVPELVSERYRAWSGRIGLGAEPDPPFEHLPVR